MPEGPLGGPAAWTADQMRASDEWVYQLTSAHIDEIDAAIAANADTDIAMLTREQFTLPTLSALLDQMRDAILRGRGFALLRGLPVERYSERERAMAYFGIGTYLGRAVSQNAMGHLLGHVIDLGRTNEDFTARTYQTNARQFFHADSCDIVGLLCVRKAKQGGESSLVSIAALYNRLLRDHPEYLGLLHRPFYYAHLGGDLPTLSPLLSFYDGKLACRYLRQYIELGHEVMGAPLSQVEIEALDIIDSITQDPAMRIDMMLEPGDIQLANNYMVMHSRTSFEDDEDPARYRKKLRLWLKMDNARRLAPDFPGRNGFD